MIQRVNRLVIYYKFRPFDLFSTDRAGGLFSQPFLQTLAVENVLTVQLDHIVAHLHIRQANGALTCLVSLGSVEWNLIDFGFSEAFPLHFAERVSNRQQLFIRQVIVIFVKTVCIRQFKCLLPYSCHGQFTCPIVA